MPLMGALAGLTLSIALPWVAGTLWVRALARDGDWPGWMASAGYGYLIGAFAITLVMRLLDAVGIRWTLPWIALPVLTLALAGYLLSRSSRSPRACWISAHGSFVLLPAWMRGIFWACLALIIVRMVDLGLEILWRPLLPWDAWGHWATKARVWFEYRRLVPFVSPAEWLQPGNSIRFMDYRSTYPATVPLLQVWTDICLGGWDESRMNAPWLSVIVSLALAYYAQMRRAGIGVATSMLSTYALTSLPFLDLQVALAGTADLYVAAAYGMAAIALWQWSLTRKRADLVLALAMAIICTAVKIEGVLWVLTLLPGAIVAINRRAGLALATLVAITAAGYLAFGPDQLILFGYELRTRFEDVSLPLAQHMFVMDNWHPLWYAAIAIIAWRWRFLVRKDFAPMTIAMLGGFAFVFVVFFYSSASGGVDDESLVNRLLLHLVPALAFYLSLLVLKPPVTAAEQGVSGESTEAALAARPITRAAHAAGST
jgi:hypothetical protein